MNYEEMLASKNDGKLNRSRLPLGEYYRIQQDGKYIGLVTIRPELHESIVFSEALKAECERNKTLVNRYQLHFTPIMEQNEVRQLELEPGVFMSMEQLLIDNPAVVAEKGFVENVLAALVEVTTYLHSQGIKHVCYSPKSVLVRKGDHAVMLLSHGSFYFAMENQRLFYGDDAYYVAPEVLEHGTIDERCDVARELLRPDGEDGASVDDLGEPGVGLDDDRERGAGGEALHEREHAVGTEAAVEADCVGVEAFEERGDAVDVRAG